MKLIIDIPKNEYNEIMNDDYIPDGNFRKNCIIAIRNGTPLPKNHGDLIDRDELLKDDVSRTMGFRECDIRKANVVIEADTERRDSVEADN